MAPGTGPGSGLRQAGSQAPRGPRVPLGPAPSPALPGPAPSPPTASLPGPSPRRCRERSPAASRGLSAFLLCARRAVPCPAAHSRCAQPPAPPGKRAPVLGTPPETPPSRPTPAPPPQPWRPRPWPQTLPLGPHHPARDGLSGLPIWSQARAASPRYPHSRDGRDSVRDPGCGCETGGRGWGRAWHRDAGEFGCVNAGSATGVSVGLSPANPYGVPSGCHRHARTGNTAGALAAELVAPTLRRLGTA